MTVLPPSHQPNLIGHEKTEALLLQSYTQARLPHALILSGPVGVGKATLAYRLARFLLSQSLDAPSPASSLAIDPESALFQRLAAGGHGDLLVVTPNPTLSSPLIPIEEIRRVLSFLSKTPMEGGWRVVIIDGLPNRNAANALLKVLEEPPKQTLLLLVTETVGDLPVTLRSRCQHIPLSPLTDEELCTFLDQHAPPPDMLPALVKLAQGRPGYAMRLIQAKGVKLYQDLVTTLGSLKTYRHPQVAAFCQTYSTKPKKDDPADPFLLIPELLSLWIYRLISAGVMKEAQEEIVPGELASLRSAFPLHPLDHWVDLWEKQATLFRKAQAFYLDRSQVLTTLFSEISGLERTLPDVA